MAFNTNSINQIAAGTPLYNEGDSVDNVYMLVKGKAEYITKGARLQFGSGSFFGLNGCAEGHYTESCVAVEDSAVFVLPVEKASAFSAIIDSENDYNGIAIYYHNRLISELSKNCRRLTACCTEIYNALTQQYTTYINESKKSGCRATLMTELSELPEFDLQTDIDDNVLQYYLEFHKIPLENIKNFFTGCKNVTVRHLYEQSDLISKLIYACGEALTYAENAFSLFAGNTENSLYRNEILLAIAMKKKGEPDDTIRTLVKSNEALIGKILDLFEQKTNSTLDVDRDMLKYYYACFEDGTDFSGEESRSKAVEAATAADLATLTNSTEQIISFADYPKEKAESFMEVLNTFISMPDREAQDDDARRMRRKISECYYDLYKAVFRAAYKKSSIPKAVDLFLDYGFVSEQLLDSEQLVELLEQHQPEQVLPCEVYTMREWLTLIYEEKKEPSKNDMGQDYGDVLRELKKQKAIDDAQEKLMLHDREKKLDYEIKSFFMPANRVVNGQLSTFVPWLYGDQFYGSVAKSFVDRQRVNDTCKSLMDIDFSIFHREVLYSDPEVGIEREYVMRQVMPVFILFPTTGVNASMWQEITGRRRDSEARLLLPVFSNSGLVETMAKMFGQYRWAFCKTEQGANWNNIQYRSITSEYSDYIQFYKKNRLLSEDRKEKIKMQIQRGRNNLREIFAMDYDSWIRNEAQGSIRLNKVAREMFATYCPFSRSLRDVLIKQPMYEEAYQRGIRERARKVHEIDLRIKALERKGVEVPEEIYSTLDFYKSL